MAWRAGEGVDKGARNEGRPLLGGGGYWTGPLSWRRRHSLNPYYAISSAEFLDYFLLVDTALRDGERESGERLAFRSPERRSECNPIQTSGLGRRNLVEMGFLAGGVYG